MTGTVKFWLRDKGYGFIQPDGLGLGGGGIAGGNRADVFCHRHGLCCEPPVPPAMLATSAGARWPYLKKGERVRFGVRAGDNAGLGQAVGVVWLDGSPIPPERRNYLGGVHERAHRVLGEAVHGAVAARNDGGGDSGSESGGKADDAELADEIRGLVRAAEKTIRNAEDLVRQLGMDPADFPTVKSATGRGRYTFHGAETQTPQEPRQDEGTAAGPMAATAPPPPEEEGGAAAAFAAPEDEGGGGVVTEEGTATPPPPAAAASAEEPAAKQQQ